jgi:hypothetical protein
MYGDTVALIIIGFCFNRRRGEWFDHEDSSSFPDTDEVNAAA